MNPAAQLRSELDQTVVALQQLGVGRSVTQREIAQATTEIVRSLMLDRDVGEGPTKEQADLAEAVLSLIWPSQAPHLAGRPEWWHTDLGALIGACVAPRYHAEPISFATAAAILNVVRGGVTKKVKRNILTVIADEPRPVLSLGEVLWENWRQHDLTKTERARNRRPTIPPLSEIDRSLPLDRRRR